MYFNYFINFLIASAIQGLIIFLAELFKFSKLGIKFSLINILIFFVLGQLFAFILLLIFNKYKKLQKINTYIIGISLGIIAWGFFVFFNVIMKVFKNPFKQGVLSVIIPMAAFLIYGVIVSMVIKNKNYVKE